MGTTPAPRDVPVGSRTAARASRAAIAVLVLVVALAYAPVLVEWVRDWVRDDNYRHGFLIIPISGYLIWRKRDVLRSSVQSPSWLGVVALVLSCALFVVGTAGAEVFTQRMSFLGVLLSLVLLLWGWGHVGHVFFPIAFLFFAIPLPYVIYYGLTAPMQLLAAKCALAGVNAIGIPAVRQGNVIILPTTELEVAGACSGIRSLYAFLAIGALAAWFTSVPVWARALLFATAIPLSIVGNAVRVWGTTAGVFLIDPRVAEGTVHELFGLVTIAGSLAVFAIIREIVRRK